MAQPHHHPQHPLVPICEDADPEELQEADMFHGEEGARGGSPAAGLVEERSSWGQQRTTHSARCSSSDDDEGGLGRAFQRQAGAMDVLGPNSSSGKSTTLAGLDAAPGYSGWANERLQRSQPRAMVACSMPASTGHVKMGSSVPINIRPNGPRGSRASDMGTGELLHRQEPSATFIPPHQFSQVDADFMTFVPGETPGNAVKRDRLRVRNAILRSTGFLENGGTPIAPLRETAELPERGSVLKTLGGLSQALHAVGSPA